MNSNPAGNAKDSVHGREAKAIGSFVTIATDRERSATNKMKRKSLICLLLTVFALQVLTSCSTENKKDAADVAGKWEGENASMEITAEGNVKYKTFDEGFHEEYTGYLSEITEDSLKLNLLFMTKNFRINRMPYEENGETWFEVEGEKMKKVE